MNKEEDKKSNTMNNASDTNRNNDSKSDENSAEENNRMDSRLTGNDTATNSGAILGTLDADFHQQNRVTSDDTLSGSNRAGNYESQSYGKSDAEEELDARNNKQD